jgi:UDP-GlcNAc:undecaprenyl-phosphate/decaprenyl-phosphate GlcNAc-1-phosphate transferase
VREYLLTLLVAAAVTYLTTPVVRRFAVRVGAMPPVRARDVHAVPTPRLGGLAMFLGMAAALLVASQLPLLRGVFDESNDPVALLSGAALIALLGAIDDRWGLDAVTKLAGQVLAAGVMALQGLQLLWLPIGGTFSLGPTEGVLLTVITVVVTINAVNFADGLDGLAAGIVAIAATAFFAYSYLLSVVQNIDRATSPTLVSAVLVGMCLGFLPHNFFPAKVFMGDSGSMLIGLLLASTTISLTGQVPPQQSLPAVLPLFLPFAVILVPLSDLVLAVVRRTAAGRPPWAPDKEHLHHRLLEFGHSHRRAVLVLYAWSAALAFSTTAAAFLDGRALAVVVATLGAAAVVVSLKLPSAMRRAHGRTGTG